MSVVPRHPRFPMSELGEELEKMRKETDFVLEVPEASPVDHPAHYGGADSPYEAIKVIEAWDLGFCVGNAVKYISRADKKGSPLLDLKKAQFYLNREVANRERGSGPPAVLPPRPIEAAPPPRTETSALS